MAGFVRIWTEVRATLALHPKSDDFGYRELKLTSGNTLKRCNVVSGATMGDRYKRCRNLKRLPNEYYRGQAHVHWSLTIKDRRTGWLIPIFYYKFREILAHTMFRYGICCPIFCLMPDHVHMLWIGITDTSDQLNAMKFFRQQLNSVLKRLDCELQRQGFDSVLLGDDCELSSLEAIAEYIARNPERKGLVPIDKFAEYGFSSCLVPGYPKLDPFQPGYWDLLWRIYSTLRNDGLTRSSE